MAHVDYTHESGIDRLNALLPDEAEKLRETPFAVIQVGCSSLQHHLSNADCFLHLNCNCRTAGDCTVQANRTVKLCAIQQIFDSCFKACFKLDCFRAYLTGSVLGIEMYNLHCEVEVQSARCDLIMFNTE